MASVVKCAETLFGERVLGVCKAGTTPVPVDCVVSQTWTDACAAATSPLERAVLRFVPICAAARIGGANERERSILNGLINQ